MDPFQWSASSLPSDYLTGIKSRFTYFQSPKKKKKKEIGEIRINPSRTMRYDCDAQSSILCLHDTTTGGLIIEHDSRVFLLKRSLPADSSQILCFIKGWLYFFNLIKWMSDTTFFTLTECLFGYWNFLLKAGSLGLLKKLQFA